MKETDNDKIMFETKLRLREMAVQDKDKFNILECFSGDGVLWGEIKKRYPDKEITILRIDQKDDKKGVYLKGDNLKFMASMDLSFFDIIDLDAYGSPFNQLEILFAQGFSGTVICTFIQTMMGALNKKMLLRLGYTDGMLDKCPSLFNRDGIGKMEQYLALNGVKKIWLSSNKKKNYFLFYLDN